MFIQFPIPSVSDYIKNGEPFGGPPTYGMDYRVNQDKYAPYAHRT